MNGMLNVSSSPHIRHFDTTKGIMADVIIALLPAAIYGCILFGFRAVILLCVTVASAVLAEFIWNKILHKRQTIGDLSAIVTGLLLGMNLSPKVPVWVAIIGSVVAIIVVKQMFGGLGHNFVNPAIAARIVLLVSFPSYMTSFSEPVSDAISSATPLVDNTGLTLKSLFFGMHSGCIGETSAFLLILGGIYLMVRRVIFPVIPVCFIGSFALLTLISGGNVGVQVLSGGLMLGAIFMATDYTTSPTMPLGKVIFGIGCGVITFAIRQFGSLPEGVSYSIILMNILVPHINKLTLSKPFGAKEVKANE
ncbi:MAG: RnfABCDGE type electron transport complex subunit D [Clostridia bacterium]|nr:RnfABCDGE type electron transport complex subunit D [Clostridia bacterium]